ncbi:hypothetical protein CVT26_010063 [Gymnopilus dilepis]|uniref:Uncharacterized protein n=1 Tax=Gymnopilus dilepis TaxID=231916 RepID=A0A409WUQ9_9AGAR|nr:hypothetical protein CVT26_010063 [Gymnopilus dilepis]
MHSDAKRDSDFPATSIDRKSTKTVQCSARTPSSSPGRSSSSAPSEQSQTGVIFSPTAMNRGPMGPGPQQHIPYSPGQPVTLTTTTTAVYLPLNVVATREEIRRGDYNLFIFTGGAQAIGLDSGTLEWVMLQRLTAVYGEKEEDAWLGIWGATRSGKFCYCHIVSSIFILDFHL